MIVVGGPRKRHLRAVPQAARACGRGGVAGAGVPGTPAAGQGVGPGTALADAAGSGGPAGPNLKPVKTGRKVYINSQGGKRARPERTAITELRIGAVELQPPQGRAAEGAVEAWVVQVRETSIPPAGGAAAGVAAGLE